MAASPSLVKYGRITFDRTRVLGNGTFGGVYCGTFDGTKVAIKRIVKDGPVSELLSSRETLVMLNLNHPNVLRLLHREESDDFWYLALELCAATLADYCNKVYVGPMCDESTALLQMTQGLAYIHSRQLVHRDIKPDNILIFVADDNGHVSLKISDFGFSKGTTLSGTYSMASGNKGTPNYMAPELLDPPLDGVEESTSAKRAIDVFALGCVFYYFLTKGFHPFSNPRSSNCQGAEIPGNIMAGNFNLDRLEAVKHWSLDLIRAMIHANFRSRPEPPTIISIIEFQLQSKSSVSTLSLRRTKSESAHPKPVVNKKDCYADESRKGPVFNCAFSSSENKLACALTCGRVAVSSGHPRVRACHWNLTTFQAETNSDIQQVKWNGDGTKLAAGCANGMVIIWQEDGQKIFELVGHKSEVRCIQWNPKSERWLATGSYGGTIIVWDVKEKKSIWHFRRHRNIIGKIVWTDPQRLVSCSADQKIKLWRIGQTEYTDKVSFPKAVHSMSYNSEIGRLVTCSFDGTVKMWSLVGGKLLEISANTSDTPLYCMDWYQDCAGTSLIACGTANDSVRVCSLAEKALEHLEILPLGWHFSVIVTDISFAPDGRYLAAINEMGKAAIWSTSSWSKLVECHVPGKDILFKCLSWNTSSTKLAIANRTDQVVMVEF